MMMHETGQQVTVDTQQVAVETPDGRLAGQWSMPSQARGAVIFAHGSGSSHRSSRNRHVADHLNERGLATLLFDLLTEEEAGIDSQSGRFRFDIDLIGRRVGEATDWLCEQRWLGNGPIGYFGASTGAAAALQAASTRAERVKAVVSRGGRVELAEPSLPKVRAPTLMIVGENDVEVLNLNRGAVNDFTTEVKMEIVPGASHLFEEPGAMDEVARLTGDWFDEHLKGSRARA